VAYRAQQYDLGDQQKFRQEVIDGGLDNPEATLLKRIRDMCVAIDRSMAAQEPPWLRDVETNIRQLRVEEASSPAGRILVQAPCKVAGPLHQVVFEHLNYL
jgi:hypothetical protein